MSEISTFAQYNKLAELLIEKVSKEDLAECAQIMALNLAHYQTKYGELPLEEKLALINMNNPNEEQLQLVNSGMEIFVGLLGNVISEIGEKRH
jgi:hypothetical protein